MKQKNELLRVVKLAKILKTKHKMSGITLP